AKFVFAMVADDEVLQQNLQFVGEIRNQRKLGLQHLQFDDHVPEQLTPSRVGKRAIVGKLVNLADVMQKDTSQHQVAIHLWIVTADQVTRAKEGDNVVKQSTDVGVMQSFRSGSVAIRSGNLRVGHERLHQSLQMRILKGTDKIGQRLPEFVDVSGRLGKIVCEFDL